MIDPANLDQIWIPEGVRPFAVGDHVRVRLSAECQVILYDQAGTECCHEEQEDGKTGRISEITRDRQGGHTLYVLYDTYFWSAGSWWLGSDFAPHELELIEA